MKVLILEAKKLELQHYQNLIIQRVYDMTVSLCEGKQS